MKKTRLKYGILIGVVAVVILTIALACSIGFDNDNSQDSPASSAPNYEYGYYTFDREMVLASGETVRFKESGDEYYRYSHDDDGYILIRDNDACTLEYAVNYGGKPVSSGVSYASDATTVSAVPKMTVYDVDLDANPELLTDYPVLNEVHIDPPLAGNSGSLVNLVVYIRFAGETFVPSDKLKAMFNAQSGSLMSYYRTMSDGSVTIDSVFPELGSNVYVYTDSQSRSYYNTNGSDRQRKESELLTNAIESAKSKFNLIDKNLDVNGDGYLDSMSFIVNGNSSDTWGSLLWPHSWNLDAIDGNGYTSIDSEGRIKVGNYSFNFASALTVGVMCHEMGHVLGAPDLYHYNYDFVPVGNWDLMQFNNDTPQYMLTYMRDKYIGGIGSEQIEDITHNGIYTLAPVSSTVSGGVLAYKIRTTRNEYFMMEYRRTVYSGFDSDIPGSGLIIYRIKEPSDFSDSEGNQNATYKGKGSKADEVYVFRPYISLTGTETSTSLIYSRSKSDVDYGYLSPTNAKFNTIGTTNVNTSYYGGNLFYSDGSNSGIVIKAREISAERIEFSVQYLGFEAVDNDYFRDKISIGEASYINNAEYAGVSVHVAFDDIETNHINTLKAELIDAVGNVIVTNTLKHSEFIAEYGSGTRTFESKFVFSDKGGNVTSIFKTGAFASDAEPVKVVLRVVDSDGDEIRLTDKNISTGGIAWSTIVNTRSELQASVAASEKLTIAVTRAGNVEVSSNENDGQWAARGMSNVLDVAAGYSHTLVVTNTLRATAFGENLYGELNVESWTDVKSVAAGKYTSYGLRADGTVLATGLNDYGQCAVESWTDIVEIAAGETHVVGLRADGTLVAAGSSSNNESDVSGISNVKSIACGSGFTAALHTSGQVTVRGYFASAGIENWNVSKIAAGKSHLIGLCADGTIVAAGDNTYNQCFTADLIDIIDIAGGARHSVFLRQDGVVEFRGNADPAYDVTSNIGNLLFEVYNAVSRISGVTVGGATDSENKFTIDLGGTFNMNVAYEPSRATYPRMDFIVSDDSVVRVTSTGYTTATVYGVRAGTATITVRAHGASGVTAVITVEVKRSSNLSGIEFRDEQRSIPEGQSMRIAATAVPYGAEYNGDITYTSSAPSVISVDTYSGMLTAHGAVGERAIITATLGNYTATATVTIVSDDEVSIAVVTINPDRVYRYGEALDLDNYRLNVSIGGVTETIFIDEGMIVDGSYDPYNISDDEQTVIVAYLGQTATFKAKVKDYVVSIVVTDMPTLVYLYGEPLAESSGSFNVKMASGREVGAISFLRSNYRGYDNSQIGIQVLTYCYTDIAFKEDVITIDIVISVSDYATGLSYKPVRTVYDYGERAARTETAELIMASGMRKSIGLTECNVHDLNSAAQEGEEYYDLYSFRTGTHCIRITYTEPLTGGVLSADVNVEVALLGEITILGTTDDEGGTYYYEQGAALGLTVVVVQKSGAVEVPMSGTLYYTLAEMGGGAFDISLVGRREVKFDLYVARQELLSDGTIRETYPDIYTTIIYVEGMAPIAAITFEDGYATSYPYGAAIDIKLKVTYEGGAVIENVEPHEIIYDNSAIGAVSYTATYFGHTVTTELNIYDYCEGLEAIEDVVRDFEAGGYYLPDVYAVMAYARRVKLLPDANTGYTITDNRLDRLGDHRIVVGYNYGGESYSTSFTLTVNDVFASIECITPPRTTYLKGERFDPTSEYHLVMRSGDKGIISYYNDNGYEFFYSPELGNIAVGTASVMITVYYRFGGANEVAWRGNCTVPNYVERLEVIASASKFEYSYGEALDIKLRAYLANGGELTINSYSSDYNPNKIGHQTVTLSYTYSNGVTYTTEIEVRVVDAIANVKVTAPNKTSYNYGEVIRWTGARAEVTYRSGEKIVYIDDEIKENVRVEYTTLNAGKRKVTVGSDSVNDYFYITVASSVSALTTSSKDGVAVNDDKREIVVAESVDSDAIAECFPKYAAYLRLIYEGSDGSAVTAPRGVRSGDMVVLVNEEGVVVFCYTVYLRGDITGNGAVGNADVATLADKLVSPDSIGVSGDMDGNGKVNLTDLVKVARKATGTPDPAPLNESARAFISDVKVMKNKEDEGDA